MSANTAVHSVGNGASAVLLGGGKASQHAATGAWAARRWHPRRAALIAGAGVTAAMLAAPAKALAAPPATISRPMVSYTVWTETELTAPTKHGKLRRRRGGG
eukprot:CAMPEP_0181379892 /NCGR_PEP_ID=MMETSP1106-20121128/19240_1 /TAXON_ID=81844 /ORGANISM="Mantoniella antarctica, Strain SL-175" /LENGTH=101 /DNA_ID=CAMNT_0023498859 /DNA_START=480 /DNA_END=782 /DNA_ORIENTATION=+